MTRTIYYFCPKNGLCTLDCEHKQGKSDDPCQIEKEKILLYGVVLNLKGNKSVMTEEYMNEMVYLKRKLNIDMRKLE